LRPITLGGAHLLDQLKRGMRSAVRGDDQVALLSGDDTGRAEADEPAATAQQLVAAAEARAPIAS